MRGVVHFNSPAPFVPLEAMLDIGRVDQGEKSNGAQESEPCVRWVGSEWVEYTVEQFQKGFAGLAYNPKPNLESFNDRRLIHRYRELEV